MKSCSKNEIRNQQKAAKLRNFPDFSGNYEALKLCNDFN